MNVTEALEMELKNIKNKKNFLPFFRDDVIEMAIVFKFSDGKKHLVISNQASAIEFGEELIKIAHNWRMARSNFEKLEYEPLIDKKEMEL